MKKQQSALTSFSLKAHFNWWTRSGFSREWSGSWNLALISLSLRQVDPPLALNKFKFDLLPIRPNGLCLRPLLAVSTTISLSHHIMYPSQSLLYWLALKSMKWLIPMEHVRVKQVFRYIACTFHRHHPSASAVSSAGSSQERDAFERITMGCDATAS